MGVYAKGLALVVLASQPIHILFGLVRFAQADHGRGSNRPFQVGVADLFIGFTGPLAVRLFLRTDQPGIGAKPLHGSKAFDVVDLIQDRQRQDLADPGHRAQSVIVLGVVLLGAVFEVALEIPNQGVVALDQREVDLHTLAHIRLGKRLGDAFAVGLVGDLGLRRSEVVLMVGVLDVREQITAATDEVQPPPQQISRGAHRRGIDVGLGKIPAAQQRGDLEGIDLVVLGFPPVDGLHVKGVAEHELDPLPLTQIRQPVPGEHAFGGDDEVVAIGLRGCEKVLRAALPILVEEDLAFPIEDAEVHGLGMQIDSTIMLMRLGVELHGSLL